MRDPMRIDSVLEALREAWERYPDWRLGQLVENASYPGSTFYIEDVEIEQRLRNIADRPVD